jgi:hypothetical protein
MKKSTNNDNQKNDLLFLLVKTNITARSIDTSIYTKTNFEYNQK